MIQRRTAVLTLSYEDDGSMPEAQELADNPHQSIPRVTAWLNALNAGLKVGSLSMLTDGGDAATASGAFTFSSASGTTTATVNGVAFSQTTGDDDARGLELADQITASTNPLVSLNVEASVETSGVVTVRAKRVGSAGNTNTLAASGTGITASGNRLTGGTDATDAATVER